MISLKGTYGLSIKKFKKNYVTYIETLVENGDGLEFII